MNIHLIKTPEYPLENYKQVLELLRSFTGPMKFLSPIDRVSPDDINAQIDALDLDRGDELLLEYSEHRLSTVNELPEDWRAFFELCLKYRRNEHVGTSDFVMLLTEQRNLANWFSMFDGKNNAFIDCKDWEYFTKSPSTYPIAYEVVANVLRTIMCPTLTLPNPYFHKQTIGCINDLCMNKSEISIKLRTADVCPVCVERLHEQGIDDRVLDQGIAIIEGIRSQLLFRAGSRRPQQLSEIILTDNNKLYFTGYGNLELKLFPLQKVLYAFYLNHLEGVRLNELSDHKAELLYWYRKFSNADTNAQIDSRIADLINPIGSSFSEKKSSLNNKIKALLGENLAQRYKIGGESGEVFKINVDPHLVILPEDRSNTYA